MWGLKCGLKCGHHTLISPGCLAAGRQPGWLTAGWLAAGLADSPRPAAWLAAGLAAGLPGCLAAPAWPACCLAGCLPPAWLPGWLTPPGWLPGWLAGWLAACRDAWLRRPFPGDTVVCLRFAFGFASGLPLVCLWFASGAPWHGPHGGTQLPCSENAAYASKLLVRLRSSRNAACSSAAFRTACRLDFRRRLRGM